MAGERKVCVWTAFVICETWYGRGCLWYGHASFVGLELGMDPKKGGHMLYEMWRIKNNRLGVLRRAFLPVRQHLLRVRCGLVNVPRWGKGGFVSRETGEADADAAADMQEC
jgi:hypothetical protein